MNKNNYKLSIFALLIGAVNLLSFNPSYSQPIPDSGDSVVKTIEYFKKDWRAGVYLGANYNMQNVSFHGLPDIPSCCPDYTTGDGIFPAFGVSYADKLFKDTPFDYELRLLLSNLGGKFTDNEPKLMYYDPTSSVTGVIKHTIDASINLLALQPSVKTKLFGDLFFNCGVSLGAVVHTNFEQKEELLSPKDLTFENGQKTRMTYSGAIPKITSFTQAVTLGFNYDLMKSSNRNWHFSPEISYTHYFNNITSADKWKLNTIALGISIIYNENTEKEVYQIVPRAEVIERPAIAYHIDTVKIENKLVASREYILGNESARFDTVKIKNITRISEIRSRIDTLRIPESYSLHAQIIPSAIDESNTEIQPPMFLVEEFLSTRMHPLLNYVFFKENSSEIEPRYIKLKSSETASFELKTLFNQNAVEVYYSLLNIIGKRMEQNPDASLTIVGCNANIGDEKGAQELSQKRAESVAEYFSNVWNINETRLILKNRNLPQNPSNNATPEGCDENRRVEIYSDNDAILAPVILSDTLKSTNLVEQRKDTVVKSPCKGFKLKTSVEPKLPLKEWAVLVMQNGDTLKKISGTGELPSEHLWMIENEREENRIFARPLRMLLVVKDMRNTIDSADNIISIERKTISKKQENREGDVKSDKYSLILFDFGLDALSSINKGIPEFVRSLSTDQSIIKVSGYSDEVGDADYNLNLSERRARNVAKALNHPNVTFEGIGETKLLFDNTYPEGRFYCRTVEIEVKTPIQW